MAFTLVSMEFLGKVVRGQRSPLYEDIAHIPLLIYVLGVKPRRVDALVGLSDLMPTVLQLAGVEIPPTVQSRSLLPLIEGKEEEVRDFVVTSYQLQ